MSHAATRCSGDARCAHLHRARLDRAQIVLGTAPGTSSSRTVLDVAREHGVEEAVVVGDAAAHEGMLDAARMRPVIDECAGRPGWTAAAQVLGLIDGRAESPLESISRLRLVRWGFPPPELQTTVLTAAGVVVGRVDLYWPEYGVAAEVDGRMKYLKAPDRSFWRGKRRQELLEDTGLVVVRWGRADVEDESELSSRLRSAFARGQRRAIGDRAWTALLSSRLPPLT